ncbi:hypothetical protein [Paenibacillus planticolens]|uniref:DUF4375 domain-containing protein n=1 Tax=Paenibacillus planticolens TaxID=2654976 RepID=A0ABX1ZWJ9_9BACL|nr:hypothetical protein [Paenibacillus planticolens]NOV03440.1 hypothetical protein [Paenibacillus planticolens]
MQSKIGLLMDVPEGRLLSFYAEIEKALAGKAEIFDRDNEMLIVSNEAQKFAVLEVMAQHNVDTDQMALGLLPEDAELTDLFSDYGFTSEGEHNYLYEKLIVPFRFTEDSKEADVDQASLQIEEHLLALYKDDQRDIYVVDRQLEELMHGIAKAYRCRIEILA